MVTFIFANIRLTLLYIKLYANEAIQSMNTCTIFYIPVETHTVQIV